MLSENVTLINTFDPAIFADVLITTEGKNIILNEVNKTLSKGKEKTTKELNDRIKELERKNDELKKQIKQNRKHYGRVELENTT